MRLISYIHAGETSFGAVVGDGVINLGQHLPYTCLREVLEDDALARIAPVVAAQSPDLAFGDIDELLPPIPNPQKIICIGVNYGDRNAEYRDNTQQAQYPSVFMRTRESLVGHGVAIMNPPESDQLDYEGEIVIVIGKAGRRIARADTWSHVAGLTLMNEGSVRDWLRHAKFNVTQGKNFARSGSCGPWLVTADEFDPAATLHLSTRVNGELRQEDATDNLIFPFDYLISYLSSFMHLKPGDIIATGTPTGAGARFDPPKYLRDGDVVEVEVPGIGTLSNRIVDEIV